MSFAEGGWLALLWAAPVAAALVWLGWWGRCRALGRFAERELHGALGVKPGWGGALWRGALLAGACAAAAIALARPQWGTEAEEVRVRGRDAVFVLDVSRSMLAADLAPSRLERAKLWIRDAVRSAPTARVGLVLFAGTDVVSVPLTTDRGFFLMRLGEADPASVSLGGTMLGDALRTVVSDVFGAGGAEGEADAEVPALAARSRDVIVITDGEDHGSFPVEAAASVGAAGARLIVVGIGGEEGTAIIVEDERGRRRPIRDAEGEIVRSSLDAQTLASMVSAANDAARAAGVEAPDGRFFRVARGTIELDEVYRELVRQSESAERTVSGGVRRRERFQVFVLLALTLLAVEGAVGVLARR